MANEIDKHNALESLVPNGEWNVRGGVVEWIGGGTEPTSSEVDAEVIRLQAVYDSQLYARTRKAKYDLLNQFELIGDDATNGTTTHKDAIAAIKAAHPKP